MMNNLNQLSFKAKAIYTLYKANKITIEGLQKAILDGIITKNEYNIIINM